MFLLSYAVFCLLSGGANARYHFSQCKARIQRIENGTAFANETITNETLQSYLWHHDIVGFDYSLPQPQNFYTVTYEGKIALLCNTSYVLIRPY